MAVAALQALSGFKFDEEEMNLLTEKDGLQRVELEKDDTLMNVYFNAVRIFLLKFTCIPSSFCLHDVPISAQFNSDLLECLFRHGLSSG